MQTEAAQPGRWSEDRAPQTSGQTLPGIPWARRLSQHREEAWHSLHSSPRCRQSRGWRLDPGKHLPQGTSRHCQREPGALTPGDLGLLEAKPPAGPLPVGSFQLRKDPPWMPPTLRTATHHGLCSRLAPVTWAVGECQEPQQGLGGFSSRHQ